MVFINEKNKKFFVSQNENHFEKSIWKNVVPIQLADEYGLNIGFLPTWGDKIFKSTWGKGPEVFNVENAIRIRTGEEGDAAI